MSIGLRVTPGTTQQVESRRLSLYNPREKELTPLVLRQRIYKPGVFNIAGKTSTGTVGNGRYEIFEQIGQGATATVDLARDRESGKLCALKRPLSVSSTVKKDVIDSRFRLEGRSTIGLDHPYIISTYDIGEDQGQPYIVNELMNGGTFRNLINILHDKNPQVKLTPQEKRYLFNDMLVFIANICEALDYAYASDIVTHRDIKPDNILLQIKALTKAKLGDFGLAKELTRTEVTSVHSILGTIDYMSPEQVESTRGIDMRSDLYAIGTILYEMVTGRPPFFHIPDNKSRFHHILNTAPPSPISIDRLVDRELSAVIMKLLEKDPYHRFQSGTKVAELLYGIAAS